MLDAVRSASGLASRIDPDTPMIALTNKADTIHRIRLLDRGGDDVVTKPFAYPELRARIAALLRRTKQRPASRIRRVGPIAIDVPGREVRVEDEQVELSAKEYELLLALSSDPTRVFQTGGAAARRMGLPEFGAHAHARQPRYLQHGLRRRLCWLWVPSGP